METRTKEFIDYALKKGRESVKLDFPFCVLIKLEGCNEVMEVIVAMFKNRDDAKQYLKLKQKQNKLLKFEFRDYSNEVKI